MKKTIAHFLEHDLKLHQRFVYEQIIHLERYRSIVIMPARRGKTTFPFPSLFYLNEIKNLGRFFRRQNVVAIHAHHGGHGVAIMPVAKKYRLPLLVSFRGRDASARHQAFARNRARYKRLRKEGALFLPVCGFLGRELVKLGFPRRKIRPLYGGIDLDRFPFIQRRLPQEGEIRILSVARLAKKKGFATLVKAFRKVHRDFPHAKLHIVGSGKDEKRIRLLIAKYGLQEAVVLKGKLNGKQIAKEMKKAHLFCLASQTTRDGDVEGIPNVLKEAMASGLPVVTTRHAGIPELVEHKKTGYLAPERDDKELARGIKYFLHHPEVWADCTREARKVIEEKFDLNKQLKRQEKWYDYAVKKGAP
ncbi:hypothetical protein BSNK01_14110 [Bacillaceae bacterium]